MHDHAGPGGPATGGGNRALAAVVAATAATSLPVFLAGALAVQVRQALGFGTAGLGVAVAAFYLAASAGSFPAGLIAERWDAAHMMRAAAVCTGITLILTALVIRSWLGLVAVLAAAGLAAGMVQPAANAFLFRAVTPRRQGAAFGMKQSAIPLATMLSGLAAPGIALTVGWRSAFGCAAVLCGASALAFRRQRAQPRSDVPAPAGGGPRAGMLPLAVLTTGFALGVAAATAFTAFVVTSGVSAGLAKGVAGLVAALSGAAAIAVRLLVGVRADRRGHGDFRTVAIMLAAGAGGYVILALSAFTHVSFLFIPAAALASGMGWGWNGLFNYGLVRSYPLAPGFATGVSQTGSRLGAVIAPILFGVLARASYPAAWLCCAGMALSAGIAIVVAQRLLPRTSEDGNGESRISPGGRSEGPERGNAALRGQ